MDAFILGFQRTPLCSKPFLPIKLDEQAVDYRNGRFSGGKTPIASYPGSRLCGIAANLPGFAEILPVFERFPGSRPVVTIYH